MSVPSWWQATLLALAVYRTTRLLGWDDVTARFRAWIIDEQEPTTDAFTPGRPWAYALLSCPFCLSWWIALAWWGGFEASATWATGLAVPFGLSAATGLIAKHLDA